MNSFTGRRTRPRRSHDFADMQEESKSKIKDLQWLVYFFEDEKVMIVSAGFSGTAANLAQRALAKVGDGTSSPSSFWKKLPLSGIREGSKSLA